MYKKMIKVIRGDTKDEPCSSLVDVAKNDHSIKSAFEKLGLVKPLDTTCYLTWIRSPKSKQRRMAVCFADPGLKELNTKMLDDYPKVTVNCDRQLVSRKTIMELRMSEDDTSEQELLQRWLESERRLQRRLAICMDVR